MEYLEQIETFLKGVPSFSLATISQNKPKCRPIGFHLLQDGRLYFGVGTFKEVYQQLQENPYAEICACYGGRFLRYYGRAVFETEDTIARSVLDASPNLRKIYNNETGHTLGIFHLEDATAEFHIMSKTEQIFHL